MKISIITATYNSEIFLKETIISAKDSIPVEEKKDTKNKENKSKTIQEIDRDKLEKKFSEKKK